MTESNQFQLKKLEQHRSFNGAITTYQHSSKVLGCDMCFSIFIPDLTRDTKMPLVTFLSGLTCTHENFIHKAGALQHAAAHNLILLIPDTSPRGDHIPDSTDYDLGQGASFYLNATQKPWVEHYQMETYLTLELQELVGNSFPVNLKRQGIFGHSMGGYGAIVLFLKHPELYTSISAFSPITAPTIVPWGQKAFTHYLGPNQSSWADYDACDLVLKANDEQKQTVILIDQGLSDQFLENQLKPEIFKEHCDQALQLLSLRLHKGYDHSYYFIQSFIQDHIEHHAALLHPQGLYESS